MAVLASSNGFSSEMNCSRYAPLVGDSQTLSPQQSSMLASSGKLAGQNFMPGDAQSPSTFANVKSKRHEPSPRRL